MWRSSSRGGSVATPLLSCLTYSSVAPFLSPHPFNDGSVTGSTSDLTLDNEIKQNSLHVHDKKGCSLHYTRLFRLFSKKKEENNWFGQLSSLSGWEEYSVIPSITKVSAEEDQRCHQGPEKHAIRDPHSGHLHPHRYPCIQEALRVSRTRAAIMGKWTKWW